MSSKLDLLLVNVGGAKKEVYQDLSKNYSAIEPPFWAALTASFIRKRNYEVKILDANAENLNFEESVEVIENYNPDLTNIVVYGQQPAASTQLMKSVGKLCKKIKEKNKSRKIILTGLHPSALPQRTLEEEACDFVGQGEGFYTILNLLQRRKLSKISGLWYKQNGEIFSNARTKNIQNLTKELDGVAWDLLPMKKYLAHNWQCLDDLENRKNYASISTSLGCPFKCDFCAIHTTFGERKIRRWSSDWVVNQLETLQEQYGVKVIKIIDEMFGINSKHVEILSNKIIERGLDFNIWAYARVDTLEGFNLRTMKKAGFCWLCLGFESGNEEVRKDVSKGRFNKKDMYKIREKIEDAGINVLGNYVLGLPEDDLKSMNQTLDLATKLNCEFANFYSMMPYPGSSLYQTALEKKWKLPESWSGYSQHSYDCQPLPTNHLSAKEVLEFRDNAFNKYFTNPKYLNMIKEKFGGDAKKHIEEMTATKLKRKLLGD